MPAPRRSLPPAPRPPQRPAPRARHGTSLVELVVALALFGVVSAAVVRALDRQARFHDGIVRILEARTQLAGAHAVAGAELRALSPAAGDLLALSDSAVTYRMSVGAGVACAVDATGVTMLPDSIANGQLLAHVVAPPQAGDTVWVFDEGVSAAAADDRWVPARVLGASQPAGACAGSPLLDPVNDAARRGWRLDASFGAAPPPVVATGTVVQVTRLARLALYRASTGESFLGWSDWNAAMGRWNVIQPVAGAFAAYNPSRPAASGVALAAADSTGAAVIGGAALGGGAALSLMTRAVSRGAVRLDGMARGSYTDSLRSVIALRNRQ